MKDGTIVPDVELVARKICVENVRFPPFNFGGGRIPKRAKKF
jgi:hypothetical protein